MGVQHVGLEVAPADLGRSEELWTLLGFERVEPPPDLAKGFTWFERDGTQIHLMHEKDPSAPPRGHVAVVAPEFERTIADLQTAGFEVERRRPHWGAPRALVNAPGGHRIELMQRPPTESS